MQTVVIRLLNDGTGRVCIHWLIRDPEGPIQTENRTVIAQNGPQIMKGARWRMACNPTLSNLDSRDGGRLIPWSHTDDPRAATCPKCLATAAYQAAMAELATLAAPAGV